MDQLNQLKTAAKQACQHELAIPTVPCQEWNNIYDLTTALQEGTIFPELNKPFYLGGVNYDR